MLKRAIGLTVLGCVTAACAPQTPEDAKAAVIAKCERQFGRMAPDPSQGNALCTCMADKMADKGLEITDALGGSREEVMGIVRGCADQVGIPVPPG